MCFSGWVQQSKGGQDKTLWQAKITARARKIVSLDFCVESTAVLFIVTQNRRRFVRFSYLRMGFTLLSYSVICDYILVLVYTLTPESNYTVCTAITDLSKTTMTTKKSHILSIIVVVPTYKLLGRLVLSQAITKRYNQKRPCQVQFFSAILEWCTVILEYVYDVLSNFYILKFRKEIRILTHALFISK